jgi:subtilisin family serine protease
MNRRRLHHISGALVALALCSPMLSSAVSRADVNPGQPYAAHPGRIIVKYRSNVTACAHCLLAAGVPFASVTGSDSLDRLHRELGVRGAHALFLEHHAGGNRASAYRAGLDAVRRTFPQRTARAAPTATAPDLSNIYVLDLPRGTDVATAARRYAADPNVEYAEPDYERRISFVPNDPFFSSSGTWKQSYPDLWGLRLTLADAAWDTAAGDGIVVAVIDTGVNYRHPDIAANMWINPGEIAGNRQDDDGNGFVDDVRGWDFVANRNDPRDRNGHGTHVAGTIAAVGNNGKGVVGMAWQARIMPVRAIGANGIGYDSDLAKAIVYAAQNGADVLNNSWGGSMASQTISDAVSTAASLGAVIVFAAGNADGGGGGCTTSNSYLGPAALPQAIAVGASTPTDQIADFSNSGGALSVAAPGVDILSLRGGNRVKGKVVHGPYTRLSGTSMAAPHVAGLAAVLLSSQPELSPDEVRWHLELNADQPGYPGYEGRAWNPYFGWGRINAANVFDTPPVTTRFRNVPASPFNLLGPQPLSAFDLHGIAGTMAPSAPLGFLFTTSNPVAWTLTVPNWLPADTSSGTGSATAALQLDGTAVSAGSYTGSMVVSAPAAVDGGASVPVAAYVHRDVRVGPQITVAGQVLHAVNPPAIATDGVNTMVAWENAQLNARASLVMTCLDGAGNLSGPFIVATEWCVQDSCYWIDGSSVALASDGTDFLLMWREGISTTVFGRTWAQQVTTQNEYVKAVRVTATGQVLDAAPIVLASQTQSHSPYTYIPLRYINLTTAFDGTAYTAMWVDLNFDSNVSQIFIARIGTDGTVLAPAQQIYPTASTVQPQAIMPRLACLPGNCLVAWSQYDPLPSQGGAWRVYGVRLAASQVVDSTPFLIMNGTPYEVTGVAAGTDNFLVVAGNSVCHGSTCSDGVVGGRVTATGAALDTAGIQIDRALDARELEPLGVTFDGTNYVVTFMDFALPPGVAGVDHQIFASRVGLDGAVLDSEPIGLLLAQGGQALLPNVSFGSPSNIVSTQTAPMLVWLDSSPYGADDPQSRKAIVAQRVLAAAP